MRKLFAMVGTGLVMGMIGGGCVDNSPPPPRVAVAPPDQTRLQPPPEAEIKPLPPQPVASELPPPAFDDQPLVYQHLPEERAFVGAYEQVGKPRILVFVNRTLEGQIAPVNADEPLVTVEHRQEANAAVTSDSHTSSRYGYWYDSHHDTSSHFQSTGPAKYTESTDIYLHPGQYDEAAAKSLDYEAVENILSDWLSSGGHVAIVSPTMARQRLTDEQLKDLQSSRPRMLGEVARELDADILIQVQIHPSAQTDTGLGFRMIAEAINVRGGESIARAVVDIPPPLDKPKINRYTRFVARKLMDGMTGSWESFGERAESCAPGSGNATRAAEIEPKFHDARKAMRCLLLAVAMLALTGCGVNPPIQGRLDPYVPAQVHFDSEELRTDTAIGQPVLTRDQFNLLHVTLPIRSAIDKQLHVQYRVTFFDSNRGPLDQQSWSDKTLTANTPDQIQVNSVDPRAADFQIDLRYPPGY